MGESLAGAHSFPGVEYKHTLEQIDSYDTLEKFFFFLLYCDVFHLEFVLSRSNLPAGSAFLNLLASGCRSRLGRD
jgi:hypothetical protein